MLRQLGPGSLKSHLLCLQNHRQQFLEYLLNRDADGFLIFLDAFIPKRHKATTTKGKNKSPGCGQRCENGAQQRITQKAGLTETFLLYFSEIHVRSSPHNSR